MLVDNLASRADFPETLADLDGAGRVEPVDVDVAPLQDEAHVGVRVPTQPGARDRLLAAEHEIGVEIGKAITARKLPGAPAAAWGDLERMGRRRPAIGRSTRDVRPALAGEHPASFDIPAAEIESGSAGPVYIDADIFPLDQEVLPVPRELEAPGVGGGGRDKTGIDQRVEVDAQLRLVAELDALHQGARLEVALVEVEHRRPRESHMQVPVLAAERAGGKTQRSSGLLAVEEHRPLRTPQRPGQVGGDEIVLGRGLEPGRGAPEPIRDTAGYEGDARPLHEQAVGLGLRAGQRIIRLEIADGERDRVDVVVEVALTERRRPVRRVAEIGGDARGPLIECGDDIDATAPQIFAVVELARAGRRENASVPLLEVAADVELRLGAERQ